MSIPVAIVVLGFITFDVITGYIKALSTKTVSSYFMRKGLWHKVGEILAVLFGYACEFAFPYVGVTISIPLSAGISTYIVLMETLSIVENLGAISPEINGILNKFFNKEALGLNKENESDEK